MQRRINEEEAEIVRRIFQLAAEGRGTRWIALKLNDERVTAPLPRRAGRPRAWAPSTIYAMLTRPLYRGEIVWNRSKKRHAWGIKKQSARPKEEWVRLEAPDLLIVPEPVWQAVQERLKTSRASYLRASNGQLWGRPSNGIESKYLLTGLAQCGVCGGGLIVHSRASGPGRKHAYLCSYYHLRGTTVCPTELLTAMNSTNEAVLDVFERQILNPKVVEVALREGLNQLRPSGDSFVPQRAALQAELGVLDQELGRLSAAVAQGGDLTALLDAIKSREQRRRKLQDELAGLQGLEKIVAIDLPQLQQDLETRLADWRDLLGRQVPVARQILKKLLVGRIVFRQTDQGIEFTGRASLGKVLAGIVGTKAGVAPTGFEPVFETSRNPWNTALNCGGSSGGSAVAVATGMGPVAIASDGGGSIRIPASFCGLYGIKASMGRVPLDLGCRDERYPGVSSWEFLEHIGPVSRTVADAALTLSVIAGPDDRDRHSRPRADFE